VVAGGPAPLISAGILTATGSSVGISWYIVGCSAVSLVAPVPMPRRAAVDAPAASAAAGPA
jgi:hypothetical protein